MTEHYNTSNHRVGTAFVKHATSLSTIALSELSRPVHAGISFGDTIPPHNTIDDETYEKSSKCADLHHRTCSPPLLNRPSLVGLFQSQKIEHKLITINYFSPAPNQYLNKPPIASLTTFHYLPRSKDAEDSLCTDTRRGDGQHVKGRGNMQ